jgi:hypothetical protein
MPFSTWQRYVCLKDNCRILPWLYRPCEIYEHRTHSCSFSTVNSGQLRKIQTIFYCLNVGCCCFPNSFPANDGNLADKNKNFSVKILCMLTNTCIWLRFSNIEIKVIKIKKIPNIVLLLMVKRVKILNFSFFQTLPLLSALGQTAFLRVRADSLTQFTYFFLVIEKWWKKQGSKELTSFT